MTELEFLKEAELIIAGNYWENWKFQKDLAQVMGGHPRVLKLIEETNNIQKEWHELKAKIEKLENENENISR